MVPRRISEKLKHGMSGHGFLKKHGISFTLQSHYFEVEKIELRLRPGVVRCGALPSKNDRVFDQWTPGSLTGAVKASSTKIHLG